MAVRVVGGEMQASPNPFSPTGPIAFSVSLRDDAAPPGGTVQHVFKLTLNPGTNLTFEGNGKSVSRQEQIGGTAKPIVFHERIAGVTTGLGFNVALFEDTTLLTSVDVTIG